MDDLLTTLSTDLTLAGMRRRAWRAEPRTGERPETWYLRFSRGFAYLMLLAGLAFCTLFALGFLVAEGEERLAYGAILAVVVLGLTYQVAELLWGRVTFSSEGFESRTVLRGTCAARWQDVTRVRNSRSNGWWILDTATTRRVRVSHLMYGVGTFVETMREEVPESVQVPEAEIG